MPDVANPAPAALAGVRVVDFTQFEAGTSCTEFLAWLGADVVKVEPPVRGEPGRYSSATEKTPIGTDSAFFILLNANKRSVTADLKQPEARDLIRDLVAQADVLVENFAPGTIERLGFDYDTLQALNPRLVYAQIKGFPADGQFGGLNAFDVIGQAAGGAMSVTGDASGPPVRGGIHVGDVGSGLHCVIGILAALIQRGHTGRGQRVEISMQEAIISQGRANWVRHMITGRASNRGTNGASANGTVGGVYRCLGDGPNDYCLIAVRTGRSANSKNGPDGQWQGLLQAMGRSDLQDDSRFNTPEARGQHIAEVNELITDWTSRNSKHEVMARLGEHGVLASAVLDTAELAADSTLNRLGTFVTVDHPQRGAVTIPGWPVRLSDSPVEVRCSPELGADNESIYTGLLGRSSSELADLKARGAI